MLSNYLKIALRNLRKRGGFSLINIAGLGLGIAASLVILLYAQHELTYDRFHTKADRIHQVYKERVTPTGTQITRDTWVPLLQRLTQTFPAIETGTRYWTQEDWVVHQNDAFQEQIAYTDSAFFDVFTFPLAQGNPATALDAPNSIVLTQETAQKYFGQADPLGEVISVDDEDFTVTGVFRDLPSNSHISFDVLTSYATTFQDSPDFVTAWGYTYVRLTEDASAEQLAERLATLAEQAAGGR